MRTKLSRLTALIPAILLAVGTASAQNVAHLACSSEGTASTLDLKVSYYNITYPISIASQSTGAGGGKATYSSALFHTSLSNIQTLSKLASNGTVFSTCVLTANTAAGAALQITLRLVSLTALNAVAGDAAPGENHTQTAYAEVTLQYGGILTQTAGSGDDGGTPVPPGWNRVTNN